MTIMSGILIKTFGAQSSAIFAQSVVRGAVSAALARAMLTAAPMQRRWRSAA